jgi:hypothetical protein
MRIAGPPLRLVMPRAVDLDGELQLRAVEVHHESSHRMLAAELESQHAAVAQQMPRMPLGGHCRTAKLPRVRAAAPRIEPSHLPSSREEGQAA